MGFLLSAFLALGSFRGWDGVVFLEGMVSLHLKNLNRETKVADQR
jgi:hypothetical protein